MSRRIRPAYRRTASKALIDELEAKIDRGLEDVAVGRVHNPDEARKFLQDRSKMRAARKRV